MNVGKSSPKYLNMMNFFFLYFAILPEGEGERNVCIRKERDEKLHRKTANVNTRGRKEWWRWLVCAAREAEFSLNAIYVVPPLTSRLVFQVTTGFSMLRFSHSISLTSSSFCPRNVIFMRIWWLYCIWTLNSTEFNFFSPLSSRFSLSTLIYELRIYLFFLLALSFSQLLHWFDSSSLPFFSADSAVWRETNNANW